jgi:hypothetical protein
MIGKINKQQIKKKLEIQNNFETHTPLLAVYGLLHLSVP